MVLFRIVGQVTCPLHFGPSSVTMPILTVHISVFQSTPLLLFLLLDHAGLPNETLYQVM